MKNQSRGLVLVLFASLCLSTVPTALKLGLAGASPMQLLAPRMVLGSALLWLWVLLTRPHRLRIDRRGLASCALAGGLNAISVGLFYLAVSRLDVAVTILVFSVYPGILLALLHLRGEAVTRFDLVRLLLAGVGIALVSERTGVVDPYGLVLALACAAVYALYVLVVHTRMATYPASTSALWMLTFMTVAVLVARLLSASQPPLTAAGWGVVIWSAVVGTAVARLAAVEGMRLLGGGQTALLMPVETVMAICWAALVLGERLNAPQLGGAALVLASVLLATARQRWRGLRVVSIGRLGLRRPDRR